MGCDAGQVRIRAATEADLPALTRLDLTYPTDRFLAIDRSGDPPEHTFVLRWRNRLPTTMAVYDELSLQGLRRALSRADLFLVAESEGEVIGYLMIVVPSRTDAAEITDLAVDIASRRLGPGRALVLEALDCARQRSYRSLWVEPRGPTISAAILFYTSLGFRLSGFNDRMYSNRDNEDGRPTVSMHFET